VRVRGYIASALDFVRAKAGCAYVRAVRKSQEWHYYDSRQSNRLMFAALDFATPAIVLIL
jgi:hypothetical protein